MDYICPAKRSLGLRSQWYAQGFMEVVVGWLRSLEFWKLLRSGSLRRLESRSFFKACGVLAAALREQRGTRKEERGEKREGGEERSGGKLVWRYLQDAFHRKTPRHLSIKSVPSPSPPLSSPPPPLTCPYAQGFRCTPPPRCCPVPL